MTAAESDYAAEHKMPRYQIIELTNEDDGFYPLLGPMLSRREIVAGLGAPVWDDDGKVWHVAVTEACKVLGMIAVKDREICSFYVDPDSRGVSVGYALLHRVLRCHGGAMKATATDASLHLFTLAGFVEAGRRGSYHFMRKDADR